MTPNRTSFSGVIALENPSVVLVGTVDFLFPSAVFQKLNGLIGFTCIGTLRVGWNTEEKESVENIVDLFIHLFIFGSCSMLIQSHPY